MTRHWVNDHEWHDIEYSELPGWVRRRIKTLHRKQLVGRHFRYRLAPVQFSAAPRYQVRLRHHISIRKGATFPPKQMKAERSPVLFLLLFLAILALIFVPIVLFGGSRGPRVTSGQLSTSTPAVTATVISPPTLTPPPAPTPSPTPVGINSHTGTYKNYYLGLVDTPEGTLSGSGCYGDFIVLINDKGAANPTYSQLVNFLQQDKTDQFPYRYTVTTVGSYYGTAESHIDLVRVQNIIDGKEQPNPPHVCADFAERLHNDAEIAGIRCAYVSVDLSGYSDPYHYGIPSNTGHALDAFQTTDRGLIYVDDTNSAGPTRSVTTVNVRVGQQYIPQSVFPESGWSNTYDSMGTVTNMLVTWDGNWNN